MIGGVRCDFRGLWWGLYSRGDPLRLWSRDEHFLRGGCSGCLLGDVPGHFTVWCCKTVRYVGLLPRRCSTELNVAGVSRWKLWRTIVSKDYENSMEIFLRNSIHIRVISFTSIVSFLCCFKWTERNCLQYRQDKTKKLFCRSGLFRQKGGAQKRQKSF